MIYSCTNNLNLFHRSWSKLRDAGVSIRWIAINNLYIIGESDFITNIINQRKK